MEGGKWYRRTVSALVFVIGLLFVQLLGAVGADAVKESATPVVGMIPVDLLSSDAPGYLTLISSKNGRQMTLSYINEYMGVALDQNQVPYPDVDLLIAVIHSMDEGIEVDHFLMEGVALTIVGSGTDEDHVYEFVQRLSGYKAVTNYKLEGNESAEGDYYFSLLLNDENGIYLRRTD